MLVIDSTSIPLNFASFLQPQSPGHHPLSNSTICFRTRLYWLNKLWKTTTISFKNKKKNQFLLVLTELNELPADRKALPLAFLPPSARALALSIGWTMERAWFAENMSFTFKHFYFLTLAAATTFSVAQRFVPADSLAKTPRACVSSTHLIFIPPLLKMDRKTV